MFVTCSASLLLSFLLHPRPTSPFRTIPRSPPDDWLRCCSLFFIFISKDINAGRVNLVVFLRTVKWMLKREKKIRTTLRSVQVRYYIKRNNIQTHPSRRMKKKRIFSLIRRVIIRLFLSFYVSKCCKLFQSVPDVYTIQLPPCALANGIELNRQHWTKARAFAVQLTRNLVFPSSHFHVSVSFFPRSTSWCPL